jgi:hypothetical protein
VDNLRLHPDLSLVTEQTIRNDVGQVSLIASNQAQISNLTGDLTLVTFTLTAQAEGQVDLTLTQVAARTRDGRQSDLPVASNLSLRISNN